MNTKKNAQFDVRNKSLLFFQIGLIIVLFSSWRAFEYKSYNKEAIVVEDFLMPLEDVVEIPITEIKKETPPPVKKKAIIIEEIPDKDITIEDVINAENFNQDDPIVPVEDIIEIQEEDPIEEVILKLVTEVPVFPGCESATNNNEKKKCMSKKINKFVQKKFDDRLAERLGLQGKQRITVLFKINSKGNVVDVKARAPHIALKKEAEDVVNQLPIMKPGRHNGKPVKVLYTLPIVFNVIE